MKKVFLFMSFILLVGFSQAQVVPLRAENWDFRPGAVEFSDGAMKIVGKGFVVLKNTDFTDGTIEFDHQPTAKQFAAFYFHFQDTLESEHFYFRTDAGADHPRFRQGVQYAPTIRGVGCWNIMDQYQGPATFGTKAPNHVKMVISGKQMRVYVNNMTEPTLLIPRLEANTTHGALAFTGGAIISHLVLKPGQTEGLSPMEGIDPTSTDPRYIRHWHVTAPITLPGKVDFDLDYMPGKQTVWSSLTTERRGLVNLTRLYGGNTDNPPHRIAWLKTTIHADKDRDASMRFGFVDEVWMFLNGKWLYVDKNVWNLPIQKVPAGRCSLENASINVPLHQGDNELLIAVGSNFWGWGVMARFDDLEGIAVEN